MEMNKTVREQKYRLFFGVAVEPWQIELTKIQQFLKQKLANLASHIIWHPIESLHITLMFLGETSTKLTKEIEQQSIWHVNSTVYLRQKYLLNTLTM